MCGIAGRLDWGPDAGRSAPVPAMLAALAHRGPDGGGSLVRERLALAHRRLAIIDVAGGAQPLANEDGTVALVANCEIYNFRELRAELQARGHHFATRSDAEVLVHGYEEWGDALPARLRGMFAFAIADFARRRLFLARDALGIKPLVWRRSGTTFTFASEIAALQAAAGEPLKGSLRAVEMYVRYRYIPEPFTIHDGVWKLPPGCSLAVGFDGELSGPHPYAAEPFAAPTAAARSDAEWRAQVGAAIDASVAAHLVADVPVGVLVSGGVDSTLVARSARKARGQALPAFTVDFAGMAGNEAPHARMVAQRLGLDLHEVRVGAGAMAHLPAIVAGLGEPLGDPSLLPTWLLARQARSHVAVVLSGDGGDEAFAGYDSYEQFLRGDSARAVAGALRRAPVRALPRLARHLRHRLTGRVRPTLAAWESETEFFPPGERRALWGHGRLADIPAPWTDQAVALEHERDALTFAQRMDYRSYLPGNILPKVDLASMAHGLEVRTPLVDTQVVALAASLPRDQRWRGGVRKYVLRSLLQGDFPDAFVHRPKQGFTGPHADWLLHDARSREMLSAVFIGDGSPLRRLFRADKLRTEFAKHTAAHDNSGRLWPLLVLGLWMDSHPEVAFA